MIRDYMGWNWTGLNTWDVGWHGIIWDGVVWGGMARDYNPGCGMGWTCYIGWDGDITWDVGWDGLIRGGMGRDALIALVQDTVAMWNVEFHG